MTAPLETSQIYTDFSEFGRLRRSARDNSPEALRTVARQFESMFLAMMLKTAHETKFGDDLIGEESGGSMYKDMYDQQLALHLAQHQSVGIADMLVRQLSPHNARSSTPTQATPFAIRKSAPSPAQPMGKGIDAYLRARPTPAATAE